METIFSKIIRKEIPAKIVFEDDLCLAFFDVAPQAPVHILIVPKKPIRSIATLGADDATLVGHLLFKAQEIATEQGLEEGYRVVTNVGAWGGQSVPHLHFHLLGGRQMTWPPG